MARKIRVTKSKRYSKKVPQVYVWILFVLFLLNAVFVISNWKSLINRVTVDSIVIANNTTTSVNVFWKSNASVDKQNITYVNSETLKTSNVDSIVEIGTDRGDRKKIYTATIENLDDGEEYTLTINADARTKKRVTFTTKSVEDSISLPSIETGKDEPRTLLLVRVEDDLQMLNTEDHGTWAFDSMNHDYEIEKYAEYYKESSETGWSVNIFSKLYTLEDFVSKSYAASGEANCEPNATVSSGYVEIPKLKIKLDVAKYLKEKYVRMSGNMNAERCFADTYCRSQDQGVDPIFTLSMWIHESASSNYTNYMDIPLGDFGILPTFGNGAFDKNYSNQLRWYLSLVSAKDNYISAQCSRERLEQTLSQMSTSEYGNAIAEIQSDPKLYQFASSYYMGCGTPYYLMMAYNWMQELQEYYATILSYNGQVALADTKITYEKLTNGETAEALQIECSGQGDSSPMADIGYTEYTPITTDPIGVDTPGIDDDGDDKVIKDPDESGDGSGKDYGDFCGKDTDKIVVSSKDRDCKAKNGCTCYYSSSKKVLCAEYGTTCKASGFVAVTEHSTEDDDDDNNNN
ncbi:fibronectin type III domain-containing protein, partial [bacterium]|nr:fibronectin type III domain-containing protein [bacterium]